MNRSECLGKAIEIITKDRAATHGQPEDSFGNIARFWTDWLRPKLRDGETIEDWEIGAMMGLFKIARLRSNPKNEDSWVDGAGYMGCGCELATRPILEKATLME